MGVVSAPDMGGVTQVLQIHIRLRPQKIKIPLGIRGQRRFLLSRQSEQLYRSFRACAPYLLVSLSPCLIVSSRCFGDNNMRIRPTKAKGADTPDPRAAVNWARPRGCGGRHLYR